MWPCLQGDTGRLSRGWKIEQHHPSTGRPVPTACFCLRCWKSKHAEEKQRILHDNDEIMDGLCKMIYHKFVGAAILLLANVLHCADCVDNIIINDIPCVKRKELGDVISKWVSISLIPWTRSIAECLLSRETFFVVSLVLILGVSILLLKIHQESLLCVPCNHSLLKFMTSRYIGFPVEIFGGCFPRPSQSVCIEL